jgi:uroporphyrinogen decarboxylase
MMTSMERVLTTLGHKEPDRVPQFLLLSMHGAKELGLSIQEYFSKGEYVAEGQIRLQKKYSNDCLYGFFYAPLEIEAWKGEVLYSPDGPPNSGMPFLKKTQDIFSMDVPAVATTSCFSKLFRALEILKSKAQNQIPIIAVVMSPFSLPIMQMGLEAYIKLMYEEPQAFERLMKINEAFCISFANAQLAAGATAICYFDPMSSPTMITKAMYLKTGFCIAKRVISQIQGPVAIHLGSAISFSIIENIAQTGAVALGISCQEDLAEVKKVAAGKIAILGNLNGIEMVRWTKNEAEKFVKQAIDKAGKNGGFILADNHGEIPFQVPDEVLFAIQEAVQKWGNRLTKHL